MTFNANQSPKDSAGRPISAGWYRVTRAGGVRIGQVFEDTEATLWIVFTGADRPQRVDELSQFCTWSAANESDVIEANGSGRSA